MGSQAGAWEPGELRESEQVMRQKVDYIHQNSVKRGSVDLPEHWWYASACNYVGQDGLIDVTRCW